MEKINAGQSFRAMVVKGEQIGRQIGFPTANLAPVAQEILPSDGVYAVWAQIGEQRVSGMLNIGFRPTFKGKSQTAEVHLFDFHQDIYGQYVTIFIVEKLRDEMLFPSVEDLINQLKKDQEKAKAILNRE